MECSANSPYPVSNSQALPIELARSRPTPDPVRDDSFKEQFVRMQKRTGVGRPAAPGEKHPEQVDKRFFPKAENTVMEERGEKGLSVFVDPLNCGRLEALDADLLQVDTEAERLNEAESGPVIPPEWVPLPTGEVKQWVPPQPAEAVAANDPDLQLTDAEAALRPEAMPKRHADMIEQPPVATEQVSGRNSAPLPNVRESSAAGAAHFKTEYGADPKGRIVPDPVNPVFSNNKGPAPYQTAAQSGWSGTSADKDVPADPGQAKKLLDFESHRLSGAKLPQSFEPDQPASGADKSDPGLTISGKDPPEGVRVTAPSLAPAKGHSPVLPPSEKVLAQIVDKAKLMVKLNSSEMNIQLKPEFLGKLSIKVLVEDGLVTARFVTDNNHVKQVLESSLGALRQSLESQGLKVDKTEVEVQTGNDRGFGNPNSWQENDRTNRGTFLRQGLEAADEVTGDPDMHVVQLESDWGDPYRARPAGQMNILA